MRYWGRYDGTQENSKRVEVVVKDGAPSVSYPSNLVDQTPTLFEQFEYTFNNFCYDDGGIVRHHAELDGGDPLPEWLTFFSNNRTFYSQMPVEAKGTYTVRVFCYDAYKQSNSKTFVINVPNNPPVFANPS